MKHDVYAHTMVGHDRAFCHGCSWTMTEKRTVGKPNRTLASARRHAEKTGHDVEVVREDTRWFRPRTSHQDEKR